MKRTAAALSVAAAVTALAPQAPALTKVGEVVLANNELAVGVSFEYPKAHVSLFTTGVQWVVDLTNPLLPLLLTSYNPAFGDQWNENLVYNGKLVCGHRNGGLNLWDVVAAPFQLASTATTYHYDGLDILDTGAQQLVFYSEHNAASAPAGLRIYDIAGATLTPLGTSLAGGNQRDGRFLVVTSDSWVYQLDGGAFSPRPLNLNVYDVSNPNSPLFIQMYNMGNTPGWYLGATDLELDPTENILYAACGFDGLRMIDIGVRPVPVLVNTYAAPGWYVRELSHLLGTTYVVVSARLPNGQWRFRVMDCSNAPAPALLLWWHGDPNYVIHDLRAVSLPQGPAVLVAGRNAAGQATLQVWM